VEPGTPKGYQNILKARELLIHHQAHIVAPCPGPVPCPFAGTTRWCHFGVRLPRPKWLRLLKEAELGYEDETFSFLMVSRQPLGPSFPYFGPSPEAGRPHAIDTVHSRWPQKNSHRSQGSSISRCKETGVG
jgi:hypothetical protein